MQPALQVSQPAALQPALCVDLDGTLLRTDSLVELVIGLVRRSPLELLRLLPFLLRGRAGFKRELVQRLSLDVRDLPYRAELVDLLARERTAGRRIVLATGADLTLARAVADHLQLFDEVYGSDGVHNLTGRRKGKLLRERFGERGFEYAGDSFADLPVWEASAGALAVNPGILLRLALQLKRVPLRARFSASGETLRTAARALRVHQWPKNLLVLIPLGASHQILEPHRLGLAVLAAFAFCLVASAVYLINDMLDLEEDRRHESKRRRPLASGALSPGAAAAGSFLLLLVGLAVAVIVSMETAAILAGYVILAVAYSTHLKLIPILDVLLLCAFYEIRLLAGGLAAGVRLSHWFLQFSLYSFLSVSMAKRYSELLYLQRCHRSGSDRRGYRVADMEQLATVGTASSLVSVLTVVLYIYSPEVEILYSRPWVLWLLCPVLLYWLLRLWLLTRRGELGEDPVMFGLRDRSTHATLLLCVALVACAI